MERVSVRLKFFALFRELFGETERELDLPVGSRVADVWARLVAERPVLGNLEGAVRFAVNREYVPADHELKAGDELVFVPPVSGGEDGQTMFEITERPLEPQELISAVQTEEDGAVVLFIGVVRNNSEGRPTRYLVYEAYPEMAEAKVAEIAAEARRRWGVGKVAVKHRVGQLEIGEASVMVAVAAPHRAEAFEACRYIMDRVKTDAPIWKKEVFIDGEVWVGAPQFQPAPEGEGR